MPILIAVISVVVTSSVDDDDDDSDDDVDAEVDDNNDDDDDDDDVNSWSLTRRLKTFVVLTLRDKIFCLAGSRPLNTCRNVMKRWTCSLRCVYSSIFV